MERKKMTPDQCAALLMTHDNFLLLTHLRPDGDAIGSAAALCLGLRSLGKSAYLYNNPQVTDKYYPFFEPYIAPDNFTSDFVVSVDTASENMLPLGFTGDVDLCVDHHVSNTYYAAETLVRANRSSCGEMVLELLRALSVDINPGMADLLYVAVSTDTGCFSYGNTTSYSLRTAAELVELGANHVHLNKLLFRTAAAARITLEGSIYSGITLHNDGRIAIARITLDMMEHAGATEADCDDIASLPGRIQGVLVSITIRETSQHMAKVSVRSSGGASADNICRRFGGGGHNAAAGCSFEGFSIHEIAAMLLDASTAELQ